MEQKERDGHVEGCKCMMCRHGGMNGCGCGPWGGGRFRLLRVLILLIILGFAFSFGVHVGEFRGEFGRGFYGRHMQSGYNGEYFGGGMMQGGNYFYGPAGTMVPATRALPATSTPATK